MIEYVKMLYDLVKLYSHNNNILLEGMVYFRNLLSSPRITQSTINLVINLGVVRRIATLFRKNIRIRHRRIKLECLWILSNIASGKRSGCQHLLNTGCLPFILKYASSRIVPIQEQALWCLGNLTGEYQLTLPMYRIKSLLFETLASEHVQIRNQAAWIFSNIYRHRRCVDNLVDFVIENVENESDLDTLSDLLWGLCYLSDKTSLIDQLVYKNVHDIAFTLFDTKPRLCLRILGNLITGSDKTTDEIVKKGVIELLERRIHTQFKEVLWICSNIAAGDIRYHKQLLLPIYYSCLTKIQNVEDEVEIKEFWWFSHNLFQQNGIHPEDIDTNRILQVLLKPEIYHSYLFHTNLKIMTILSLICYQNKEQWRICKLKTSLPIEILMTHNSMINQMKLEISNLESHSISRPNSREIVAFLHSLP